MKRFQFIKQDKKTKARLGILEIPHGKLTTPLFMPVGTNATVKAISAEELRTMGAEIVLSNTYHLFLRPGVDIIEKMGGLHSFMGWERPLLTDSGGYQVFSLAKLRRVTDEGVTFQSHIDGSTHFFSPEGVISIEKKLGADIIMPLDECAPYPCEYKEAQESVQRTTLWARRSKEAFFDHQPPLKQQILFGIMQGATYKDLRQQSCEAILDIGFEGYAIGGVSVGEPVDLMFESLIFTETLLPQDSPRYLMGIGLPDQIVKAVALGIDMFDTCIPTRFGRNGTAFTQEGKLVIRNAEFSCDPKPIDPKCDCFICRKYSRSYIRHLINIGEILGLRFVSYHNVYFYLQLMKKIQSAIEEDRFGEFQSQFLTTYGSELAIDSIKTH